MINRLILTVGLLCVCWIAKATESLDALYKEAYKNRKSNPEYSLKLISQYLQLSEDRTYMGSGYFLQGDIQFSAGDDHLALTSYYNALNAYGSGNRERQSKVSKSIGELFYYAESYDRAREYFHKSLDLSSTKEQLASNWYNLGITFRREGELDSAIHYLDLSTAMRQELNDWQGVIKNYNELGLIGMDLEDYELARHYFIRSESMIDERKQEEQYSWILHNLGTLYVIAEQFDSAKIRLNESLVFMDKNKSRNLPKVLNQLGEIAELEGDELTAVRYYRRSISVSDNRTDPDAVAHAHQSLSRIYEVRNIDSAYYFSTRLVNISLNQRSLQNDFEREGKKYRLELIDSEFKARELARERERQLLFFWMVGLFVILCIGLMVLTWYNRVRSRAHDKTGLLKMVSSEVRFFVELLLYENDEKQKTIDEYKRNSKFHKGMRVTKRPNQ